MVTNKNIIFKNKTWLVQWVIPKKYGNPNYEIQITKLTFPMPTHGDTDYFIYNKSKGTIVGNFPQGWIPEYIKEKAIKAFKGV